MKTKNQKGMTGIELMVGLALIGIILTAIVAANGCSLNSTIPAGPMSDLLVKNASRSLGYAVANSKSTVDDQAIVNAYNLFKTGQVDPTVLNGMLSKFSTDPANQLLVLAALDLLQVMGASVSSGSIMDISKIKPEMWSMVETSYQQGYALGALDKKKGITRALP